MKSNNFINKDIIAPPLFDVIYDADYEIWTSKQPQPGDHIRVQRMNGLYAHHGIYVSDSEVIHFTGADDDSVLDWSKPEVIATDLAAFLKGGTLEVKEYTDEEFADLYSPEQIISYARHCLGDKGYNLLFNNCEHFANVCTLGRFRSRQVERVLHSGSPYGIYDKGNDNMSIWGSIKSFFGFGSSGSGSRSTTTYEPDKVKIAQIEAESKQRLSEMETERIELRKQAQLELIDSQRDAQMLIEQARAKGFIAMAQSIALLQEKLNEVAKQRLEIIEHASMPMLKEIENFYAELKTQIDADNDKYNTEKLPRLLDILEKYPEGSTAHKLFSKRITDDMESQMRHYDQQFSSLLERQKQVIASFHKTKEQAISHTDEITNRLIEQLGRQALGTNQAQKALLTEDGTQDKPQLENKITPQLENK